jgi:hypothetical protein
MRRYQELAEVEAQPQSDGSARPLKFRAWNRDYLISEVLDYWCQDRQWWVRGADPEALRPVWMWRVKALGTRQAIVILRDVDRVWHVIGVED